MGDFRLRIHCYTSFFLKYKNINKINTLRNSYNVFTLRISNHFPLKVVGVLNYQLLVVMQHFLRVLYHRSSPSSN